MDNAYLILKSLHIIFVVTWFAGLFYIFRLFVYHSEALTDEDPRKSILHTQYSKMEGLLWKVITAPSAILTLIFGSWMLYLMPELLYQGFMQLKLVFVACLVIYSFYAGHIVKRFEQKKCLTTSQTFRYLNEVSTVILIAVVFLIVMRDTISWIYGVVGIVGISIILAIAIGWYKRMRGK